MTCSVIATRSCLARPPSAAPRTRSSAQARGPATTRLRSHGRVRPWSRGLLRPDVAAVLAKDQVRHPPAVVPHERDLHIRRLEEELPRGLREQLDLVLVGGLTDEPVPLPRDRDGEPRELLVH